MHTFAAAYPENPDEETKQQAGNLLKALSVVYPCRWCRDDWKHSIEEHPPELSSRKELELWMCERHNDVNVKLGKEVFDCKNVQSRWHH